MRDLNRILTRVRPKLVDIKEAREAWAQFRVRNQWGAVAPLLTPPTGNVKLGKSGAHGLSLAPAQLSEDFNVCKHATPVCRANCVAYAGKGTLPKIIKARVTKTLFLGECPDEFVTILSHEIGAERVQYVRLNTFSDLEWELIVPWLFDLHQGVQFYDYTKHPGRMTPPNYHLTYSASERTSLFDIVSRVDQATNVAVVFSPSRVTSLPSTWEGMQVIDGDKSDARYKDPEGVVVGLRAKGTMRTHGEGMVQLV